jgi:hypothetical protein
MPNENIEQAKDLLIKFYLELKLKGEEEILELSKDKIKEEKNNFKSFTLVELINYISKTINILIDVNSNLKFEERMRKQKEQKEIEKQCIFRDENKSLAEQYEELLIKAENDIRKHLKVRKKLYYKLYYIMAYICFIQYYRLNKN